VIMLFRLRMQINDAIEAFVRLSKHVFSRKQQQTSQNEMMYDASQLEDALNAIIQKALTIGEEESKILRMLDERGSKWSVSLL